MIKKTNSLKLCMDCKFWLGPGINVDHAHCCHCESPNQTTSKNGDKNYDSCLYWTKGEK